MDEPADFWEKRYAGIDKVWSGRANQALVDVASTLTPGRALDLGCGEGGDAVWLARHGWQVTGVDISPSAIARARAAADTLGLGQDRIHFVVTDLNADLNADALDARPDDPHSDPHPPTDGSTFDLVTACFLQSPVALSRELILRRAADRVSASGHLLVVSHAAPPPWSSLGQRYPQGMPQPADELAALDLPSELWVVELAEVRQRQATGPDGQQAVLEDGVVLLRRR